MSLIRCLRSAFALAVFSILAACGGGGGGGGGGGNPNPPGPSTFTVGGTVSGLAGSGLTLQNNGGNALAVSANGAFTFTTAITSGASYQVTVSAQPTTPGQTCSVSNGSGTIGANVTNVTVTCTTNTHTISGTVSGLAGSGLVLQNNGANNLAISSNGAFAFPTAVTSGSSYAITVASQPSGPAQTCTVANGSGTVSANVTDITITCSTTTFSLGGTVSGLAGTGLVLHSNSGQDINISTNGAFTFPTALAGGTGYQVTVATQPTNPGQTCSVSNGVGVVTNNVANVTVTCSTNTHTIFGNVSGLNGTGLVLQNNGTLFPIAVNGDFVLPALLSGSSYNITVATQPTGPSQTCSVANGSGTITGNVTNVSVTCSTNTFTLGGTITGLNGSGLVLRNSTGEDLDVTANGTFQFQTPLADTTPYHVAVLTQPSTPTQTCTVTNGSGTISADVSNVTVSCVDIHTIGGTVSGLAGTGLVLQNNAGDNLTIGGNGPFTFATTLNPGSAYAVSVSTQPSNVTQTCDVTNGSGTVAAIDITNVTVNCTTNSYTIRGSVTGMDPSTGLVVGNNTGESVTVNADGNFAFTTQIDSGQPFSVTIDGQPINPTPRRCSIQGVAAGTVTNANIDVAIFCVRAFPTFAYAHLTDDDRVASYAIDASSGQLRVRSYVQTDQWPTSSVAYTALGKQYRYVVNQSALNVSGFSVNKRTGELAALAGSPFTWSGAAAPGSPRLHPSRPFLSVLSTGTPGNIATFAIDESTGVLTEIPGSPTATIPQPTHFEIDPLGRFAYVASENASQLCAYVIDQGTGALGALFNGCVATGNKIGGVTLDKHGRFLYVVNFALVPNNSNIAGYSIDAATGRLTPVPGGPIIVPPNAELGAIHPNGKFIYVTHHQITADPPNGFSVFAIDPVDGTLTEVAGSPFDTTSSPEHLAFDPSGRFLYATSVIFNPPPFESSVRAYRVDTTTGALTVLPKQLIDNSPEQLTVDASGRHLYVTSGIAARISSFNIDSNTGELTALAQSPTNVGRFPDFITTDDDDFPLIFQSKFVYVADAGGNLVHPLAFSDPNGLLTLATAAAAGSAPYATAVDSKNRFVYASNSASNNVSGYTIDTSGTGTLTPIGDFNAGGIAPTGIATEQSGRFLYVTNAGSNNVQGFRIDQPTGALTSLGPIAGAAGMVGLTAHPNGAHLYVLAPGAAPSKILIYDINVANGALTTGTPLSAVPAGTAAAGIAIDPSAKYAYVTDGGADSVLVYNIEASGALSPALAQTQTLAAGAAPRGVAIDPTGKFVFTADHGNDTVSAFAIQSDGSLVAVTGSPFAVGDGPASVAVDYSGRYLLVTSELDSKITTYPIDPSTGALGTAVAPGLTVPSGAGTSTLSVSSHTQ